MSATPRSSRLSKPGEVVAILVASAAVWVVLVAVVATLFFAVFIPKVALSGQREIPGDFPVYPGAHLESAIATASAGCTTVTATWSTPDGPAAVTDFYRQHLAASDWTVTEFRALSDSTVIYFQSTSVPNREGYLSVASQPFSRRTNITMTVAKSATGPETVSGCHVLAGAAG